MTTGMTMMKNIKQLRKIPVEVSREAGHAIKEYFFSIQSNSMRKIFRNYDGLRKGNGF